MCGISGIVGESRLGLIAAMNLAQAHRGPDGWGAFEDPTAGLALGHVRLAILDLSDAAAQPMQSADGRHVLSFNGEIYNFRALRVPLEQRGVAFRSTGDAEVLLYGLAEEGENFLGKLNGIFALAWWDRHTRTLVLARDPAGVKPLYYACPKPGVLVFASEIKALFAYPDLPRRPNYEALQEHLARSHASGTKTALAGVFRLPPGHVLCWSAEHPTPDIRPFWRPRFGRPVNGYRQAVADLTQWLQAASTRQLVSDVPLGVLLSGGLDSSLIARFAVEGHPSGTDAYTITYPASENLLDQFDDDTPHAVALARSLGMNHHLIEIRPDVAALLPKLLWHLDEPVADPAIIAAFLISQEARQKGTVVLLSGQGGDELFAGYPRYQAMAATRWLATAPSSVRRSLAWGAGLIPGARQGKSGAFFRRVRRVMEGLGDEADERFMAYCSSAQNGTIGEVLSQDLHAVLKYRDSAQESLRLMAQSGLPYGDRFLYRDLVDYLPNHNLLYTDKMGMAVGVEARVPLLDQVLLDTVPGMPYSWKVNRLATKRILRDAAKGWVPDSIIHRRKAGFGAPYRKWLRYDLAELWGDVMSERSVKQRGWFDTRGLAAIRERSQSGKADLYMLQWGALTCELWAREFLDRNPSARA